MDEEEDDDQKSRKLAIKSLTAHLGFDDSGDENSTEHGDDGLGSGFLQDSFASLARQKKKGKSGGGGGMGNMLGGMGGGSGGGGGSGMGSFDLSSLSSMLA